LFCIKFLQFLLFVSPDLCTEITHSVRTQVASFHSLLNSCSVVNHYYRCTVIIHPSVSTDPVITQTLCRVAGELVV